MNNPKKEIDRLRDRIDKIDLQLVKLFNKRAKCAEEIGKHKLKLSLKAYSPGREREVMRNISTANTGPLSVKAMKSLFKRVIEESRSVERVTMDKKGSSKKYKVKSEK